MERAKQLAHPMDSANPIAPETLEVLDEYMKASPSELALKRRLALLKVKLLVRSLEKEEQELHASFPSWYQKVVAPRKILAWKKLLEEFKYDDLDATKFMMEGCPLVGTSDLPKPFDAKIVPATLSEQELRATAKARRQTLVQTGRPGDAEHVEHLVRSTLDEVDRGFLDGPFTESEVSERLGHDAWTAVRRFVLVQGAEMKLRPIDDCAEAQLNDAFTSTIKLRMMDSDYISALALKIAHLEAERAARLGVEPRSWVGKTLDLTKAYKQLPLLPAHRDLCVICIINGQGKTQFFIGNALVFGATSAVFSFNRVARSLWFLVTKLMHLPCGYFYDDYPIFGLEEEGELVDQCVSEFLSLLGWEHATSGSKGLAFDKVFTVLESAEQLQTSMGKALECAIEFGREEERTRLYTQAKEKCSRPEVPRVKARPQIPAGLQEKLRQGKAQKEEEASKSGKKEETGKPTSSQPGPFWGPHARVQPAEEETGKEWREKVYEDTWKAGRTIRSDEEYLQCTYYPFSPEWQEKVRKELLDLAHRGFATNSDGELYPTRKFASQLQSYREFMDLNNSLQKENRNRWTIGTATPSVGERWRKLRGSGSSTQYWEVYPRIRVCALSVGQKAIGRVIADSRRWYSNCGNLLSQYCSRRKSLGNSSRCVTSSVNGTRTKRMTTSGFTQLSHSRITVQSAARSVRSMRKKYKDAKMRYPEEYPEIEPPEDERGERPVLSSAEAIPYAASKKAAKLSDPEQSMASHSEALLEMLDSAKKRRAKLLEKESKQKAIDVDEESASKKEESASKKARGKGQGSQSGIWTKEPLPAGHWQDRPRREPLSPDSQEAKEALRQKVEDLKKEQLEEHHKKKLRDTFEKHFSSKEAGSDAPAAASSKEEGPKAKAGPGPDEAGSDPSSDEESESSSSECNDPVQATSDCPRDME